MHEISLATEAIGRIGPFPLTNTLLASWFAMGALMLCALLFSRAVRIVPQKGQAAIELVFDGLLSLMDSVTQDRAKSEKFTPLVLTIFLFVITANWMGILPGVGSLMIEHAGHTVPLVRSAFSDLNNTLAIAIIAVVATHIMGIISLGAFRHIGKFISFKSPMLFFVGLLEAVSELAKVLSFSFRLFGNIFAGEVLLIVIGALIPVIAPIPFLGLELFVGFIQALVFAVLTLVFLTMAIVREAH